jgi:hypothetical protein
MLEDLKVSEDPKQIGYYAGVIESTHPSHPKFIQLILLFGEHGGLILVLSFLSKKGLFAIAQLLTGESIPSTPSI